MSVTYRYFSGACRMKGQPLKLKSLENVLNQCFTQVLNFRFEPYFLLHFNLEKISTIICSSCFHLVLTVWTEYTAVWECPAFVCGRLQGSALGACECWGESEQHSASTRESSDPLQVSSLPLWGACSPDWSQHPPALCERRAHGSHRHTLKSKRHRVMLVALSSQLRNNKKSALFFHNLNT